MSFSDLSPIDAAAALLRAAHKRRSWQLAAQVCRMMTDDAFEGGDAFVLREEAFALCYSLRESYHVPMRVSPFK